MEKTQSQQGSALDSRWPPRDTFRNPKAHHHRRTEDNLNRRKQRLQRYGNRVRSRHFPLRLLFPNSQPQFFFAAFATFCSNAPCLLVSFWRLWMLTGPQPYHRRTEDNLNRRKQRLRRYGDRIRARHFPLRLPLPNSQPQFFFAAFATFCSNSPCFLLSNVNATRPYPLHRRREDNLNRRKQRLRRYGDRIRARHFPLRLLFPNSQPPFLFVTFATFCLNSLRFLLSNVNVVQTVTTSQKDRRQSKQKETKVTKVRRSYSRAPLSLAASAPEFPTPISLRYLCYLLFKFSSFSSVECECCPDRNHITGQKTI
jgi:hypothetical protein